MDSEDLLYIIILQLTLICLGIIFLRSFNPEKSSVPTNNNIVFFTISKRNIQIKLWELILINIKCYCSFEFQERNGNYFDMDERILKKKNEIGGPNRYKLDINIMFYDVN